MCLEEARTMFSLLASISSVVLFGFISCCMDAQKVDEEIWQDVYESLDTGINQQPATIQAPVIGIGLPEYD